MEHWPATGGEGENVLGIRRTLEFGLWSPHSQALQGWGGEGSHEIILQTKVVFPR